MIDNDRIFHQMVFTLRSLEIPFAVVGGIAVSAYGVNRNTKDMDFAVLAHEDKEAEQAIHKIAQFGYRIHSALEQDQTQRLATVRILTPESIFSDFLFASSGIEPEIVAQAQPSTLLGLDQVPVAARPHLIATKILAYRDARPLDLMDAIDMIRRASPDEMAQVPPLLRLIETRGYDRGEDLPAKLERAKQLAAEDDPFRDG